jgi:hypothetical protein
MPFPARSNLLRGREIASSGIERPPRNDTLFLEKAMVALMGVICNVSA